MRLLKRKPTFNREKIKYPLSKYSVYGVLISLVTIVCSTLVTSLLFFNEISLSAIIETQRANPVLWILNFTPIIFAVWGQIAGRKVAYKMGTLLVDQSREFKRSIRKIDSEKIPAVTHDSLTGLPNRTLFKDRLEHAIKFAKRQKSSFCVYILNLKRFKEINNTLGHFSGDLLLNAVALRLQNVVRASDTLARISGDEYAMLFPGIKKIESVHVIAKKIMKVFYPAFVLEGLNLEIQACIGAVLYPNHGEDGEILLQRANIALHAAKREGNELSIYNDEMDQYTSYRLSLSGELKRAIHNDELELYYQPKIDLRENCIVEVESLVRWTHKKYGLIYPDEFINQAERTGIIKELSSWVAKETLNQIKAWHQSGVKIGASVNLSARNLMDRELPLIVKGLLDLFNVSPENVTIEITETAFMADPNTALEMLNQINKMGVIFSIDDFGTGYSSLSYLTKLPISELKIDKSFVMDMMHNEKNAIIVKTIIEMGHNLGLKVVAEGVEDKETFGELKRLGCDIAQGNFISKPLPIEKYNSWMRSSEWKMPV